MPRAFTILCYNILVGGQDRLPAIRTVIRGRQPDVVALVEANDRANAETLARELGMEMVMGKANSPHHIAWLSRLPVLRVENHRLPVLSRTLLETEVDAGGSAITLFATHLSPVLEAEGNSRLTEAKAVLGVLASGFDRPHLLAGDFNALHPEDTFGIPPPREADARHTAPAAARQVIRLFLEAGYRDCYRSLHPRAAGYTYASDCPWARIDFIFASPEMAPHLRGCDIVTGEDAKRASDHFPIWAEFA